MLDRVQETSRRAQNDGIGPKGVGCHLRQLMDLIGPGETWWSVALKPQEGNLDKCSQEEIYGDICWESHGVKWQHAAMASH